MMLGFQVLECTFQGQKHDSKDFKIQKTTPHLVFKISRKRIYIFHKQHQNSKKFRKELPTKECQAFSI